MTTRASSSTPQRSSTAPAAPLSVSRPATNAWCFPDSEYLALCGSRGVSVVSMVDGSNLASVTKHGEVTACAVCPLVGFMAFVTDQKRRVVAYDMKRAESITDLYFDTDVLNVRINSKRLAVVCTLHVHLFDLNTMDPLPQIRTANPPNADGLVALGPLTPYGQCVVAVPQSADSADESRGDVFLIDTITCSKVTVVCAHKSAVTQIAFSGEGNAIATCSAKGNVIRVFSVSGQQLFCYKRGTAMATIFSLALNGDASFCACTSSSGTVHVFRAADAANASSNETRSFLKVAVGAAAKPLVSLSADGRSIWILNTNASATDKASGGVQQVVVARHLLDENTTSAKKDVTEWKFSAP